MVTFLKNLYKKLNTGVVHGSGKKTMPLDAQKRFLEAFPEPRDDYERSYFKYRCFGAYCYYGRKWMLTLYNLGAMVLLPYVTLVLKRRGKGRKITETPVDAVVENVPRLRNEDVIPDELTAAFTSVHQIESLEYQKGFLTAEGAAICSRLRSRYFWQFYFRLIVTIKLALFNHYLYDYGPKVIAFYGVEREFPAPLQTLLCEELGAEYVSFMHGDYLYALCFAFQRHSRYYTWDEAYNRMFTQLRCRFPMTVYQPRKLSGIARKQEEQECGFFATYYFSDETRACAEKIREVFDCFARQGLRCKIRPHPRFSDLPMLREVFAGYHIEDPGACPLADSITDSVYTVGLNTTVLSQAYFSGKKVAIDDISMPEAYLELKDKQYIMLNRPHALLSQLMAEMEEQNPYDASCRFFTGK